MLLLLRVEEQISNVWEQSNQVTFPPPAPMTLGFIYASTIS